MKKEKIEMDTILKIAIYTRERVILLDNDLVKHGFTLSKGSDMFKSFQQMKGRHYKKLQNGQSGWSFRRENFCVVQRPMETELQTGEHKEYEIDIPDSLHNFFSEYLIYCH